MKFLNILLIVLLAIIIIGCSSTSDSTSERNSFNDHDALANLMIENYKDHSDTLVIFSPGIDDLGDAVLNSRGVFLNKDYEFLIENKYMQLVFTQIDMANFMNISDSIFSRNNNKEDEFISNDERNYLIVKLNDNTNYLFYQSSHLDDFPELKKLELIIRIINDYARNYDHNKFIENINDLNR